jgi:hypothetical protein
LQTDGGRVYTRRGLVGVRQRVTAGGKKGDEEGYKDVGIAKRAIRHA